MERKHRAISREQKQARAGEIVDVAEKLLAGNGYAGITMARIADEAGLAKGTLFLYFETKEEVFLALAERKIDEWCGRLGGALEAAACTSAKLRPKEFIDIGLKSVHHPALVKLLAILDDTLEQNISLERAVRFKTFLKEELTRLGALADAAMPAFVSGDGMVVLSQLLLCLIGSYKVCTPSETMRIALQEPGLEFFNRDFSETLREMVTCHVLGYIVSHGRLM